MPVVVNKNPTATLASFNLSRANDMLRHSLAKLSSGKRIINASDDAGGLAVAYKMESALKRTEAVRINVQNGLSFLQVQDGGLKVIGKILDRMSELRTYSDDITKSASDTENYSKEFVELQQQLLQISREKFNGISLFTNNAGGDTDYDGDGVNEMALTLLTTASGVADDGYVSITQVNLQDILTVTDSNGVSYNLGNLDSGNVSVGAGGFKAGVFQNINAATTTTFTSENANLGFIASLDTIAVSMFTGAIEDLADSRAENGGEMSRLMMVNELLIQNQTNLEAAHGRIMDADIALESTRFARQNVLVQSSAAMVAQANQLTNIALAVLG
jgi:flagellin